MILETFVGNGQRAQRAVDKVIARRLHQCPAPGCKAQIPGGMAFCHSHWHVLPLSLQRTIWAEFRKSPGSHAHLVSLENAMRYFRPARNGTSIERLAQGGALVHTTTTNAGPSGPAQQKGKLDEDFPTRKTMPLPFFHRRKRRERRADER